jgi:hypothetical protein
MSDPVSKVIGMGSDNPTGADNQQERPGSSGWMDRIPRDLGNWVAGFVDGEGSFNVPIRRAHDRGMPWRIGLSFNVSQIGDAAPALLQSMPGGWDGSWPERRGLLVRSHQTFAARGVGLPVLRVLSVTHTQRT